MTKSGEIPHVPIGRLVRYDVDDLRRWFEERLRTATARGVREEQIVLDPGFDFDLSTDENLIVLRRLEELHELGRPLYVSLSRKDFLGAVLSGSWEDRAPAEDREWATAAPRRSPSTSSPVPTRSTARCPAMRPVG